MLSTILYSVNPKNGQQMDGFVAFSENDENTIKRKARLEKDVIGDAWKNWSGGRRRDLVEVAKSKGYEIKVKLCLIEGQLLSVLF